jgi:Uma2 family endonuclease
VPHRYTYADYVALEMVSSGKHEFLDGEIYAMAGGSEEHSALAAEIVRLLGDAVGQRPQMRIIAIARCGEVWRRPGIRTHGRQPLGNYGVFIIGACRSQWGYASVAINWPAALAAM